MYSSKRQYAEEDPWGEEEGGLATLMFVIMVLIFAFFLVIIPEKWAALKTYIKKGEKSNAD